MKMARKGYDPNQKRDKYGRWVDEGNTDIAVANARKGAGLEPEYAKTLLEQLKDQGFSTTLDGIEPQKGFMTAFTQETELKLPIEEMTTDILLDYVEEHLEEIVDEDNYFGGWLAPDDDGVLCGWLDVSHNYQSFEEAMAVAKRAKQKAIWDVIEKDEIKLVDYFKD
jgi:hypothetical protein